MPGEMPGTTWRAGHQVTVEVPASSANLGPGFDAVGVGLDIRDSCTVAVREGRGVAVVVTGEGEGTVPTDDHHLVVRAMRRAWEVLGVAGPPSLHITCGNAVPHGRGLGSSATAIVTGISAAYGLWTLAHEGDGRLDLDVINDLAADLEGHPDNSSASVFGGMTLSWLDDRTGRDGIPHTRTVRLTPHPSIRPHVLVPDAQLSTATARAVLPSQIRLADAAANSARVGLLVHAMTADPALLLPATRDYLHQEPRRPSYAASMALVDALRAAGVAATISGAGPSVLALAIDAEQAALVTSSAPAGWRVVAPGFADTGARLVAAAGR